MFMALGKHFDVLNLSKQILFLEVYNIFVRDAQVRAGMTTYFSLIALISYMANSAHLNPLPCIVGTILLTLERPQKRCGLAATWQHGTHGVSRSLVSTP